jgi:hypothetical protein
MKRVKYFFGFIFLLASSLSHAQTYFNRHIARVPLSPIDLLPTNIYLAYSFKEHQQLQTLSSINNNYSTNDSSKISPNALIYIEAYTRYKKYKNASLYTRPNRLVCYETYLYKQYYTYIYYRSKTYDFYDRQYPYQEILYRNNYVTDNPNLILIKP